MENLLTHDLASAEALGSLKVYNVEHTLELDTTEKVEGNSSYKVTFLASASFTALYNGSTALIGGITGDKDYTFSLFSKTNDSAVTWRPRVYWYDEANVHISSDFIPYTQSSKYWTRLSITAKAPTNAKKFYIELDLQNVYNGFSVWWDKAQMEQNEFATLWVEAGTKKSDSISTIMNSLKTDWQPSHFYNHEDLNRVETAVRIVYDRLKLVRGNVTFDLGTQFASRTKRSIEYVEELSRIEGQIALLVAEFPHLEDLHDMKTDWNINDPFDFNDANRYEQNLDLMFRSIEANLSLLPYCGQYIAGQEGVL